MSQKRWRNNRQGDHFTLQIGLSFMSTGSFDSTFFALSHLAHRQIDKVQDDGGQGRNGISRGECLVARGEEVVAEEEERGAQGCRKGT